HNYLRSDTYFITLTVKDIYGFADTAYLTLIINNSSPTAIINSEALLGMFSGEKRIFSAVNSFDSDGNIDSYIWSAASTPDSFVYSETFIYIPSFTGMDTITLKVIDNYGYYSETMVVVNIRKPNADIEVKVSGVRPEQHYYTLAFEDLYPNVGDGDYNDFVCDYNVERILNSNNQITQIKLSSKALARGAGYTHKFKVKLKINGSANIIVNEYKPDGSKARNTVETTGSNNLDITLFQNTAEAFKNSAGVNISNPNATSMTVEGNYAEAVITLSSPAQNPVITSDTLPYNPYLYVNNTAKEIYLNSIDANGYPFALLVPTNWSWPKEAYPIDTNAAQINNKLLTNIAYPLFQDWRLSGYNSKINWYDYPNERNVVKNTRPLRQNKQPQIASKQEAYPSDIITLNISADNLENSQMHYSKIEVFLPQYSSYKTGSAYPEPESITKSGNETRLLFDMGMINPGVKANIYLETQIDSSNESIGELLAFSAKLYVDTLLVKTSEPAHLRVISDLPALPKNLRFTDFGNLSG
ncbi:MAG TPA: LruC domain-containing protein, partial [bacterium]|nr:LruC domain-containing protein [bacterium]